MRKLIVSMICLIGLVITSQSTADTRVFVQAGGVRVGVVNGPRVGVAVGARTVFVQRSAVVVRSAVVPRLFVNSNVVVARTRTAVVVRSGVVRTRTVVRSGLFRTRIVTRPALFNGRLFGRTVVRVRA